MNKTLSAIALSAVVAGAAVPVFAQSSPSAPSAGTSESAPTITAPTPGAATTVPTPDTTAAATPKGTDMRAGDLIGAEVTNSTGEAVGEIEDLVIGPDQKVTGAIVSVGGFLGVGDKLISIALSDIQVTPTKDGEYQVMVSASKDELKALPAVEAN
ncbi:PRC-barrel domain-containing protein [Oleomonas cavernae]|nr:PRC-barrel domain-containing protein [Oleomonas cavernae]